jgi:hypothetical protein
MRTRTRCDSKRITASVHYKLQSRFMELDNTQNCSSMVSKSNHVTPINVIYKIPALVF